MSSTLDQFFIAALTFCLGGVLLVSGTAKVLSRADLRPTLSSLFVHAPDRLISVVARVIPWYEVLLGALWCWPSRLPWISIAGTATFMLFWLVSGYMAIRQPHLKCHCFSDYFETSPRFALARNTLLVLGALFLCTRVDSHVAEEAGVHALALAASVSALLTMGTLTLASDIMAENPASADALQETARSEVESVD